MKVMDFHSMDGHAARPTEVYYEQLETVNSNQLKLLFSAGVRRGIFDE